MLEPVCILNNLDRALCVYVCVCACACVYSVTHARTQVPLKAARINKGAWKPLLAFAGLTSACTSPEPRLQSVSGGSASPLCKQRLNEHRWRREREAQGRIVKRLQRLRVAKNAVLGWWWWNLPAVTRTLLWASMILSHRASEEKPAN